MSERSLNRDNARDPAMIAHLADLVIALHEAEGDEQPVLQVPHGVSALDRAAMLDSAALLLAELRRRGYEAHLHRIAGVRGGDLLLLEVEEVDR